VDPSGAGLPAWWREHDDAEDDAEVPTAGGPLSWPVVPVLSDDQLRRAVAAIVAREVAAGESRLSALRAAALELRVWPLKVARLASGFSVDGVIEQLSKSGFSVLAGELEDWERMLQVPPPRLLRALGDLYEVPADRLGWHADYINGEWPRL
jgi:hypothetical protein